MICCDLHRADVVLYTFQVRCTQAKKRIYKTFTYTIPWENELCKAMPPSRIDGDLHFKEAPPMVYLIFRGQFAVVQFPHTCLLSSSPLTRHNTDKFPHHTHLDKEHLYMWVATNCTCGYLIHTHTYTPHTHTSYTHMHRHKHIFLCHLKLFSKTGSMWYNSSNIILMHLLSHFTQDSYFSFIRSNKTLSASYLASLTISKNIVDVFGMCSLLLCLSSRRLIIVVTNSLTLAINILLGWKPFFRQGALGYL